MLSVIIPCFNEKKTMRELLEAVARSPVNPKEVIVIDDASTDGTTELLESELADLYQRLLKHAKNQGKGAALRTGIKEASGDIVLFQDADLEYDPDGYSELIQPIVDDRADVVYGSRFIGAAPHRVLYFWHRVGNGIITLLSNMATNLNLTDIETCYKAFRREIIQSIEIEEDRFGVEPEITAKVARMRCRVYEVGIPYFGRTYEEGKKIGWRDGVRAIYCIFKYNLRRR